MRVVALTVLFVGMCLSYSYGQGSFIFDQTTYTFDTLYQRESANAVFLIKNTGHQTLYLEVSSHSTNIELYYPTSISPGQYALIQASKNHVGLSGAFVDTLDVKFSNSIEGKPEISRTFLTITGFLSGALRGKSELLFNNSVEQLGTIKEGSSAYFNIPFKNNGSTGVLISEVRFKNLPFLYTCGYAHEIDTSHKPLVGSNEIIKPSEIGSILLKLAKTDLPKGTYRGQMIVFGNFKERRIRLKFKVRK